MKPIRWNTLDKAAAYLNDKTAKTDEQWTPHRVLDAAEQGLVNVQAVLPAGTQTFTDDGKRFFTGGTVSLEGVYLDSLLKHDQVFVSATTNRWDNVSVNLEPPAAITMADLGITGRDLEAFAAALAQQAGAVPAPVVLAPASEPGSIGTVTHSTKPPRRDTLTPVIELAQKQCLNPKDTAEVWVHLSALADSKSPPFIDATDEGLKYLNNGTVNFFNREALRKRLAR